MRNGLLWKYFEFGSVGSVLKVNVWIFLCVSLSVKVVGIAKRVVESVPFFFILTVISVKLTVNVE